MEMESPQPCPYTVTVRRNPSRRARPTPSSAIPLPMPISTPSSSSIPQALPSFRIDEILSTDVSENPQPDLFTSKSQSTIPKAKQLSENLNVFLRIRPLTVQQKSCGKDQANARTGKNAWPQNPQTKNASRAKAKKKSETCISVNDSHSVTLCPPTALQDGKRLKSEVYEGFSHVFPEDSSQDEVFKEMVNPLVEDFLSGKSGMLAALGPSGSGKTHTVFGSAREPGMLPLALRQIFSRTEGKSSLSRTFYLSMLEICSEKGKAERILDLSQGVGDLCMQQSTIKGLQEVIIRDIQQAESVIARGMLKRATAMTNSNSQSSRSQCIINIRSTPNMIDEEVDLQSHSALLTIVDLAGAEREKRTGNQGARLLESSFINNTSMVFGLCLRALLEHQKNPRKPLQKHFQNSLLTRYLRDYLEGRKRMALMLTVKSGDEDYLDTSFLLRQASPCMKIKFNNVEETINSVCAKRHFQAFPRTEKFKKVKLSSLEACSISGDKGAGDEYLFHTEALPPEVTEVETHNPSIHLEKTDNSEVNGGNLAKGSTELEKGRMNEIMQNFAKALWNVLKQYKEKLQVAEKENQCLRESLDNEKAHRFELEAELKDLKSYFLRQKEVSMIKGDETGANRSAEKDGCPPTDAHELNAGFSSLNLDELENTASEQRSDTSLNNCGGVTQSSLAGKDIEEKGYLVYSSRINQSVQQCTDQECRSFPGNAEGTEVSRDLQEVRRYDIHCGGDASDSGPSVAVSSSPKSLVIIANDCCSSLEGYQSHTKEDKPIMPEEDAELASRGYVASAPESESKLPSCCQPLTAEKPKRRLLPASSILLKNISSLDFEDQNEKPKVSRGEKKLAPDDRNRTQGSISLLRLLRSNLHL